VFIYAILNFALFFVTESRYPRHEVPFFLEVRLFTGHSMMFYGWGLAGYVGLARWARRRQSEPVNPNELSAEKRPTKDLETSTEDDDQNFGMPKLPTGKAADYCVLLATAVWTFCWLGAACLAMARIAQAMDAEALAVLAITVLVAGTGCVLVVLGLLHCFNAGRPTIFASADNAAQSRDQMQAKDSSSQGPSHRRILNLIISRVFSVIWCGVAIVWTFGCFVVMLGVASRGPSWFMLVLVPFSLVSLTLLFGLFGAAAAVIESLVRILRRASSWL
jgi:hypothetical protein